MILKRRLVIFLLLSFLLFISACASEENVSNDTENNENMTNFNETGMPIVNEPITLEVFTGINENQNTELKDVFILKEYEKMTNIHINWLVASSEALEERRNLTLVSDNLPDIFYSAHLPVRDLYNYGKQGVLIELNDLIEQYMPNLQKLMEENPEIKKGLTFPDGKIYSLPLIISPEFTAYRSAPFLWINQDWLNQLEMEVPSTTDEFYNYLREVKETDLIEGEKVPYGGVSIDGLIGHLKGSFGIGNRGAHHSYIDVDPKDGNLRFIPISDNYKAMLEYVHKLYSEELIDQRIYSIEWDQYLAFNADNIYGSTVYWATPDIFGEDAELAIPPLEGPYGDKDYVNVTSILNSIGQFAISKDNQYLTETARWVDYFYSDEGSKFMYMGVEGITYEKDSDGNYKYLDELLSSDKGEYYNVSKYLNWRGQSPPGLVKQKYFGGSESSEESLKAAETIEPYTIDEVWPNFTYTEEEIKELDMLANDIEKYVDEMRDYFITGRSSFDEWDHYIKTIENMGLEKYMSIQEEAYNRY